MLSTTDRAISRERSKTDRPRQARQWRTVTAAACSADRATAGSATSTSPAARAVAATTAAATAGASTSTGPATGAISATTAGAYSAAPATATRAARSTANATT